MLLRTTSNTHFRAYHKPHVDEKEPWQLEDFEPPDSMDERETKRTSSSSSNIIYTKHDQFKKLPLERSQDEVKLTGHNFSVSNGDFECVPPF